jgi:hypothetical protein
MATIESLRQQMRISIDNKKDQGHAADGLCEEPEALPHGYDAHLAFAHKLVALPMRPDWPDVEPNGLEAIWTECDPDRPLGSIALVYLAENAFCVLAPALPAISVPQALKDMACWRKDEDHRSSDVRCRQSVEELGLCEAADR